MFYLGFQILLYIEIQVRLEIQQCTSPVFVVTFTLRAVYFAELRTFPLLTVCFIVEDRPNIWKNIVIHSSFVRSTNICKNYLAAKRIYAFAYQSKTTIWRFSVNIYGSMRGKFYFTCMWVVFRIIPDSGADKKASLGFYHNLCFLGWDSAIQHTRI